MSRDGFVLQGKEQTSSCNSFSFMMMTMLVAVVVVVVC